MPRRSRAETPPDLGVEFKSAPNRHAFLAPAVITGFQYLRINASLRDQGGEWHGLNTLLDVTSAELAHGRGVERGAYNDRSFARVAATRKPLLTRHAGFWDFFWPIAAEREVEALLVTGPFALKRPTRSEISKRWSWLTGDTPNLGDPRFLHYLTMTLDVLTLDERKIRTFRAWLERVVSLLSGRGQARAVAIEAARLHAELEEARFVDRMWAAVRSMLDERSERSWLSQQVRDDLARIRMRDLPEHVLVGLLERPRGGGDALAELLKRDAFQRACVDLARSVQSACGRVGDQGVVFLCPPHAGSRATAALRQLRERSRELARRRFGFELHVGEGLQRGAASLNESYTEALGAAEEALSRGIAFLRAEPGPARMRSSVRALRRQLSAAEEQPRALISRFERYIEAVHGDAGHRLDLARIELETGFDQAALALLSPGVLAEKSYLELCNALERAARDATTLAELLAAYRTAIATLVEFAERPVQAAQERSLGRALEHIRQHSSEPLRLAEVARVAGFAPSHFAELFKRSQKTTVNRYLQGVRIERAKELLQGTDLSADRVGQLSGFPLRHYFHRVFKKRVGMTPMQYRKLRPKSRRRRS